MNKIEHVVQLMFENRSLDNLLGYLYTPADPPKQNIPPENPPRYDGLAFGGPYSNKDQNNTAVPVHDGTAQYPDAKGKLNSKNVVPTPNSGEPFDEVTQQIFNGGNTANMSGFVANYESQQGVTNKNTRQIMDSYATTQLKALSALAKSFAVCDAWFSPMPTQTWPNRGFAHCGSSDGHVLNKPFLPWPIDTIFTVLENLGISWNVFHDTLYTPALTMLQFRQHFALHSKFDRISSFLTRCNAPANALPSMKLPAYSFVEPRFIAERVITKVHHSEDYHPPNNVQHAEKFLVEIYNAVRSSPYRDRILLLVTFDEHGGTYDHVVPPSGATAPLPKPVAKNGFKYDRWGVRTPAVVVSSYVKPGTVFRAKKGATPYDHTSVLATLRDWKKIAPGDFLPSPRIAAAPTLDAVLTESQPNQNWPEITSLWHEQAEMAFEGVAGAEDDDEALLEQRPDDLEQSIVGATEYYLRHHDEPVLEGVGVDETTGALEGIEVTEKAEAIPTREDAMERLRGMVLSRE
ncbi:MAG TPA: alkaline phosphatase family protein [Thermoanaerobaculia bacterium]|nr:alkaline phosphatase family protein [Thermoanaerobaculia bacterium]